VDIPPNPEQAAQGVQGLRFEQLHDITIDQNFLTF
jgi:hypothetical protein